MKYFVYSHKNEGLFTKEQLADMALQKDDLVKVEGTNAWLEAEMIPDLAGLLSNSAVAETGQVPSTESKTTAVADTADKEMVPGVVEPTKPSTQVVNPIPVYPKKHSHWFLYVSAVAVLAVVMAISNPNLRSHYVLVDDMISESVSKIEDNSPFSDPFFDFFLGDAFSVKRQVANRLMNDVSYNSCGLFSYCSVDNGIEGSHLITLGLLGHVFSFNQDELDEHMNRLINPQKDDKDQPQENSRKSVPEGSSTL